MIYLSIAADSTGPRSPFEAQARKRISRYGKEIREFRAALLSGRVHALAQAMSNPSQKTYGTENKRKSEVAVNKGV